MTGGSPNIPSALPARLQLWLSANAWSAPWQPAALQHPIVSYVAAAVAVVLAAGITAMLERVLPGYGFHGMMGFLALLIVAINWGLGPAALGSVLNAFVLSFLVEPPALASVPSSFSHSMSHGVSAVLSLAFGLAIGVLGSLSESRRRQLDAEHIERERLLASEQRAHTETEAALRRLQAVQAETDVERDRLQRILNVLPVGVVIFDAEARIVAINNAAQALIGADAGDATSGGRSIDFTGRILQIDGTPSHADDVPMLRSLLLGEDVRDKQYLLRNLATGRDLPVLASCAPLRDASGASGGAVCAFQDTSVLKNLERQRDHVLATVTHDLRNPLTSISGMSQILQMRVSQVEGSARERFAHCLATIEAAARRMTEQIGELLDYAQAQTGHQVALNLESVDVVDLLRQVLEEHQHSTDKHILELHAAEESIVAMVDPRRLERAIANLIVNAIKYSLQGGLIVVSAAQAIGQDGRWLHIAVSDRGLGIPSADLPHMFEQYYRGSNVAATIPGTGIGLASVRHMILKHGGTVTIDSTEGVGTTVTVRLPLVHGADGPTGTSS